MTDVRYLRYVTGGAPVVAAPAEIDVTTAAPLRAILLEAAANGHATVVVDLTGTRFCDSSGLHTLLRAHNRAAADGGEPRLVVPPDGAVPAVLNLTGLGRFIPCFSSLAQALAPAPRRDPAQPGARATCHVTSQSRRSGGGQVVTAR